MWITLYFLKKSGSVVS